jgi:hypothetical protein
MSNDPDDGLPPVEDPDELNFPIIAGNGELTDTLTHAAVLDPVQWARAFIHEAQIGDRLAELDEDWIIPWFANAMLAGLRKLRDATDGDGSFVRRVGREMRRRAGDPDLEDD